MVHTCCLRVLVALVLFSIAFSLASYDHVVFALDHNTESNSNILSVDAKIVRSLSDALSPLSSINVLGKLGCVFRSMDNGVELEDRNEIMKQNILSLGGPFQVSDLYIVQNAVLMTNQKPSVARNLRQNTNTDDGIAELNEYDLHKRSDENDSTDVQGYARTKEDNNRNIQQVSSLDSLAISQGPTPSIHDVTMAVPTLEPTAEPTAAATVAETSANSVGSGDGNDGSSGDGDLTADPAQQNDDDEDNEDDQGTHHREQGGGGGGGGSGGGEENTKDTNDSEQATASGSDFLNPRGNGVLYYFLITLSVLTLLFLALYCCNNNNSNSNTHSPSTLYRGYGARTSPGRAVDSFTGGRVRREQDSYRRDQTYSWFGYSTSNNNNSNNSAHPYVSSSSPSSASSANRVYSFNNNNTTLSPSSFAVHIPGIGNNNDTKGRQKLRQLESLGELRPLASAMDEADLP